jgi:hypothetical protein
MMVMKAMRSPLPAGDDGPLVKFDSFDMGTSDVDGYEGEDGDNANADQEEEASLAEDGSTRNVENRWHGMFDVVTRDVDGYEGGDGDNADEEEEALQANDESTKNVDN